MEYIYLTLIVTKIWIYHTTSKQINYRLILKLTILLNSKRLLMELCSCCFIQLIYFKHNDV